MMWFTADLHLGDTNILHDMDRPFGSVEEMNRKVIDAVNECVAADDRLYILGRLYLSFAPGGCCAPARAHRMSERNAHPWQP